LWDRLNFNETASMNILSGAVTCSLGSIAALRPKAHKVWPGSVDIGNNGKLCQTGHPGFLSSKIEELGLKLH